VLLIGDDVGYADAGFMGSDVAHTPNLDRLAEGGTVFPLGYTTASTCRPSLRSLLTGLEPVALDPRIHRGRSTPGRTAVVERYGIDIREYATLPRRLAAAGYVSFQSGKFFESSFRDAGFSHGMTTAVDRAGSRIARETMEPLYAFVDAHRDRPFLVWFAPKLPHHPMDAAPEFHAPYEGADLSRDARDYFANLTRLDDAIGRIVRHLERQGLRERTLLVYLADNGWVAQPAPTPASAAARKQHRLLGGPRGKQSLYDAGYRTPLVFNGPAVPSGRVRPELVSILDLFPTLLEAAGAPARGVPGESLWPLIRGEGGRGRREIIGFAYSVRADLPDGRMAGPRRILPGGLFVRTADWHYLEYGGRPAELYRVKSDPAETENVAERYPDVARQLAEKSLAWSRRNGLAVEALGAAAP
jgi:arylsulfatase A-like enzyme